METLRLVIHRQIPEDDQLRREWNALGQQMEYPEVFYTYEWALAVHRAYHNTMVPLLVLAYEGESLVGVASLGTDPEAERIFFLANTTADYCDFVSHPQCRAALVDAVFTESRKLNLPRLTLANLPSDSATKNVLSSASHEHGYSLFSRPAYLSPRIMLGSGEERSALKQSLRKRKGLRYALKGLAKHGPVTMENLKSWESIEPVLPQFMEAHIARFAATGRTSNIAQPERQRFLREIARLLSNAGWMVLTRLSSGDQAVAWNYGFQFSGSWFYYQPTFETALQQYSPGVCLLSKMVEEACDDPGISMLDLGLGAEGYKERFATTGRQTLHVTATTSAASCLKEKVRHQAATAVKSVPPLENWVRSVLRQASSVWKLVRSAV